VLGYALSEAFKDLLPRGRYPLVFLHLDLPAEEVDVNVHPTKKEVRFRQASDVRDGLLLALQSARQASAPVEGAAPEFVPGSHPTPSVANFLKVPDLPVLPAFDYPARNEARFGTPLESGQKPASLPEQGHVPADVRKPSGHAPWKWCRILGQISGYFVVLETDEGMILMDPQAAHERVLYERLMREISGKRKEAQGLLAPETAHLPPVLAGLIRKHLPLLRELGLGISPFGGDTFLVDAMPSALGLVPAADLLRDIADDLDRLGKSGINQAMVREHICQVASRTAVRTTTQLSREELERLIGDLAMAELPYTSPRGRPTIIFTSVQEIKKKFGRD
jgi:DNA mismatch repair protein MutL